MYEDKKRKKINWVNVEVSFLSFLFIIWAIFYIISFARANTGRASILRKIDGNGLGSSTGTNDRNKNGSSVRGCRKVETSSCLCGSEEDWRKAKEVKRWYFYEKTNQAQITKYTPTETCSGGKYESCVTAMGTRPIEGITAACPRNIRLGTKIRIEGKEYICQDRTAYWIEKKYISTFDIFTKNYQEAKTFGRQKLNVTIIYETKN